MNIVVCEFFDGFKFKQGCIEGTMGYIPVYFLCKKSIHMNRKQFCLHVY